MFETLDADMLAELMKLDARSTLKKETQLADLLACLEQAARECKTPAVGNGFSGHDAQQIAAGIDAAQHIVEKIWTDTVVV